MTSSASRRTASGAHQSMWLRSRWWTTLACALTFAGGLWAAWGQHTLHALLLMAAALLLARGSVWGRRARRAKAIERAELRAASALNPESDDRAPAPDSEAHQPTRPGWREVA